jgi:hypothetical protein
MNKLITEHAGEKRIEAFQKMCDLAEFFDGSIVETGSIRTWPRCPDGASTVALAAIAQNFGREFTSIDINSPNIDTARFALEQCGLAGNLIVDNSIVALRKIRNIGLLYLDSYDYEDECPERCQRHAMAEIGAAWGGLSWRCVVAIDDWNDKDGGKGGMVIPYLMDNKFKIQYEGYIRIYSRGI